MESRISFCVIYQFRVSPELAKSFVDAWSRLTTAICHERGGLGSRLHRGDGDLWVAYAQWPSRELWERSRELGSPDAEASAQMTAAITERFSPILLEPELDLLKAGLAGRAD